METPDFLAWFFFIFGGAACCATLALMLRLPLILAYIVVGALLGPQVLGLIENPAMIENLSHTGIVFLLFLLGLDMQPSSLLHTLRETLFVGVASTLAFFGVVFGCALLAGLEPLQSAVAAAALSFSSTILGIKLLPTTALHHRHIGELSVGILLFQDILAIGLLLMLDWQGPASLWSFAMLPALIGTALLLVRYLLLPLLDRFDVFHEYVFMLAIGWCLGVAFTADSLGLSAEIGAFIAGITLATHPVAQYIAESLKPLRDFFLIFFFCSVGAGLDFALAAEVLLPAALLAAVLLVVKPLTFMALLIAAGEKRPLALEVGTRLGQASEFSLLVAFMAFSRGILDHQASHLVQVATILTFLVSTYLIVLRHPTPIALTESLRRN
jgi:Kef-type K+ transport system membrane component KefB